MCLPRLGWILLADGRPGGYVYAGEYRHIHAHFHCAPAQRATEPAREPSSDSVCLSVCLSVSLPKHYIPVVGCTLLMLGHFYCLMNPEAKGKKK